MGLGRLRQRGDRPLSRLFLRRHQAEMTFRQRELRIPRQGTQQRNPRRVQRVPQPRGMARASDVGGDDAGHRQVRIKRRKSHRRRSHAAHSAGGVDGQHDRRPQPLGEFRGAALLAVSVVSIEEPHHALDHGEIGSFRSARAKLEDSRTRQQPRIEIPRDAAGRRGVERRIDEVGPRFERLHPQAAAPQGAEDSQRDRGLPGSAVSAGDDNSGNAHGNRMGFDALCAAPLTARRVPGMLDAFPARCHPRNSLARISRGPRQSLGG